MARSVERYGVFKAGLPESPYRVGSAKTLEKARIIMNEMASLAGGDFYVFDSKEEVTVAMASIRSETYTEGWRGRGSKLVGRTL